MSSAYLRLLIFLPVILIPASASSSVAFCMMYSAYKLNEQGDNKQPWCAPYPIWNQSIVPCPVLTVASWPAYRFLKRWVRWSGIPISLRVFHSSLWSTVKGFGIVNKAKVYVFLELSFFFNNPAEVAQSCPTFCEPMNHSTPGLPVIHQLPEFTQTHVHWVGDAIQPPHPLLSPSPPAPNHSQHQGLFQWVNSSCEVARVLEFQL